MNMVEMSDDFNFGSQNEHLLNIKRTQYERNLIRL